MSKHTKGPWTYKIEETATVRDSRDNQLSIVTYLFTKTGGRRSSDEVYANARLMAAAPELLEALEAFVVKHRQTYGIDGAWDEEIVKAEAVIAKAKGEQ